jgi:hypothetical protein
MSDTLTVPAALANCVREGLHIEIGHAAEQITGLTERPKELPVEIYRKPFRIQREAQAILEEIGGETPVPPASFTADLSQNHGILLTVIYAQRQTFIDNNKEETDGNKRRQSHERIRELDALIATIRAYTETVG